MLKKAKEDYFSKNIQFVLTGFDGIVVDSDQTLVKAEIGKHIEHIHSFFNCIHSIEDSKNKTTVFNCVQLGANVMEFIVDVEMTKKEEGVLVMIHDLTEHYKSYQLMAQARNESIINSELIVLKNLELEEREKFKNQFIGRLQLNTKIFSLAELLELIKFTYDGKAEELGLEFKLVVDAKMPELVEGDRYLKTPLSLQRKDA